jgi:uncharacterized glyoxalase superfamily protein PhnB
MRFADADAALDWLAKAFGFTADAVHRGDDGVVQHAEMSLGAGSVMFGQGDPASIGWIRDPRQADGAPPGATLVAREAGLSGRRRALWRAASRRGARRRRRRA